MAPTRNPYLWSPTTTLPDGAYITGPYIDADKATNFPTNAYLTGLRAPKFRKLEIPQTLLTRGRANDNINHPDPAEEWRVYLCSAIVRHFSYRKFTSPLSTGHATPSYRRTNRDFMQTFMTALPTASTHTEAQKHFLIQLERQLTHETFGCFPELFTKVFSANAHLATEVSTAMLTLDVVGEDFESPRALMKEYLSHFKTAWIDLTEPIDVVSGDSKVYKTYIESQARRREIMARLVDYIYLLADPTPEMYEKARTRARVFDGGVVPEQGSGTVVAVAAESSSNDPETLSNQQHQEEVPFHDLSDHHRTPSRQQQEQQQQQRQNFRIYEDPVVTVFGVDPSEVRVALHGLMMRPASLDVPFGQENRDPMTRRRGEREVSAETVRGEGEREMGGRGDGESFFGMGVRFMGEWR